MSRKTPSQDSNSEEMEWDIEDMKRAILDAADDYDKLLFQYVEWVANRRLRSIGLKPQYDIPAKNNPLPWTEHWISSKGLQVAPQETEVESYVVGGIKQDVKKDTFSGFKL